MGLWGSTRASTQSIQHFKQLIHKNLCTAFWRESNPICLLGVVTLKPIGLLICLRQAGFNPPRKKIDLLMKGISFFYVILWRDI